VWVGWIDRWIDNMMTCNPALVEQVMAYLELLTNLWTEGASLPRILKQSVKGFAGFHATGQMRTILMSDTRRREPDTSLGGYVAGDRLFVWNFVEDGKMPLSVARYLQVLLTCIVDFNTKADPWVRGLAQGYNTFYLGALPPQ
jgi:hypothetical protein